MRVCRIACKFKVLVSEFIDVCHSRVQFHFRKRVGFPRKLQFNLFNMIQVDVSISQGANKSPGFSEVICAIIRVSSAYEAILKGTPRKMSQLRW